MEDGILYFMVGKEFEDKRIDKLSAEGTKNLICDEAGYGDLT